MFEDALVESSGKLKSKSKYWMLATLAFNLAILAALILFPLLHPAALPRTAMTALLTAPPPPPPAVRPTPAQVVRQIKSIEPLNAMTAPAKVPRKIDLSKDPPPPNTSTGVMSGTMLAGNGPAGSVLDAMGVGSKPVVVTKQPERPKQPSRVNVSSGVAAGALLTKTTPTYPAIAKAAHVSGAVLLHAIISKTGTIESLQVVSGPEMLRANALDAVRQWRYNPYLLNGEPTEVETTITVNFTFAG
ncbi:energy transducer TonB [Terriglobus sp.]|uniref:energy transducer TonB n=1 Tax=Terriglobus sp. TaxID=1889013 RepID=UPI003B00B6B3